MLYALLCYDAEDVVCGRSPMQQAEIAQRVQAFRGELEAMTRQGPWLDLMPTTTAVTLRGAAAGPLIIDGPVYEHGPELLGVYVVECQSLDDAIASAAELSRAGAGQAIEIRPILPKSR